MECLLECHVRVTGRVLDANHMWERTPLTGHLNIFESWYSKVPGEILFIEITYYLIRRVALSMEYTLPFLHSVRSITRPKTTKVTQVVYNCQNVFDF